MISMESLLFDIYYFLVDYFNSPEAQRVLFWAKVASFGISCLLLVAMIILLSRSRAAWWVSERIDSFRKVKLPQRIEQAWLKIQERIEKGDEANLKLAVIEAESILDDILKRMALPGKDMGERLEQINKQQLNSLDEVWEAHRLRNLIVHQSGIKISYQEAERAVRSYEKALKELEVL